MKYFRVFFTLALMLASQFCVAQTAYITNYHSSTVSVINVATNIVTDTIAVGIEPQGVSVSPDGSKVYVTNSGDGTVSVINTTTDSVLATITVGGEPLGIVVSPDETKLYVVNGSDSSVSVINTATNTISDTIAVGNIPLCVAVIPDGSKVYVTNSGDGTVSVINTASNIVSDTISVGFRPAAFGNFISTYIAPLCGANFSIYPDTTQLHHYLATDNSYGTPPLSYVWSWGDGTHDTIPYPSHTYADSGFYDICLSITDSTGCQSAFCDSSFHAMRTTNTMVYVNVVNPLILGTKEVQSQTQEISIYPNPATDKLFINANKISGNSTIAIYNLLGEIIYMEQLNSKQETVNCKPFPAGIYFVQVSNESSRWTGKFVKE